MAIPRRRDEQYRAIPRYRAVVKGRRECRIDEECALYRGQGSEVLAGIDDGRSTRVLVTSVYRSDSCLGQFTPCHT